MNDILDQESERIKALHELNILDTDAEERFDRITRLTACFLKSPMALVSLVDEKRQWFKSRVGLDACETDRRISFCAHAIKRESPFIVKNALEDKRFADNPLVTGAPFIRSYIGIPLQMKDGNNMGTLCAIDTKPREFTAQEIKMISDLAAITINELENEEQNRLVRELKRTSRELHEAHRIAESANRAKSDFLAVMSHEIRTPLNSIIGFLRELKYTELSKEQLEFVELSYGSSELLLALINDILDFSKIEAGKLQLEQKLTNPQKLVKEVAAQFRTLASDKGLNLITTMAEGSDQRLFMDPLRVQQILFNFISNAVKFTQAGDIEIHVAVEPTPTPDELSLIIAVRDSGIGISPTQVNNLFNAFEQLETSKARRFGGSGLGLAICRKLADLMHGSIQVHSEVNHGSTFTLRVPVKTCRSSQDSQPETEYSPADSSADEGKEFISSLPILLVEDNSVNIHLMKHVLKRMGCQFEIAHNGREAVQTFAANPKFKVILMDVQMPEMDGLEATRAIRQLALGDQPHIIALTAHAESGGKQDCLNSGMNGFISKPMREDELRRQLLALRPQS